MLCKDCTEFVMKLRPQKMSGPQLEEILCAQCLDNYKKVSEFWAALAETIEKEP